MDWDGTYFIDPMTALTMVADNGLQISRSHFVIYYNKVFLRVYLTVLRISFQFKQVILTSGLQTNIDSDPKSVEAPLVISIWVS